MKISTVFLIVIAIQFSVMMYGSSVQQNTALFGFIQNPTDWSNTTFITMFGLVAIGIAGVVFVGAMIFGKTDTMIFASTTMILVGFAIPITSLWQLIYEERGMFGGSAVASGYVASLLVAPLIILAIFSIINWWRGNSEM